MKFSAIVTAFQLIGTISCFILYPFSAENLLTQYLNSLSIKSKEFNVNIVNNAVPGEQCNRQCSSNDTKICHFKFSLEFYQILGGACNSCLKSNSTGDCFNPQCIVGDGVERTFMSINRQLPGPAIQVCKDDIIVVDVDNQMEGTATTIHWHGLLQYDTPYSDGVPYITQCPVPFSTTFRYIFYAGNKGTHLYHSHAGLHKANGIYGALIVRDEMKEDAKKLFDYDLPDFNILCSDWMHVHAEEFFPGLPSTISLFDSILINGHGRYLNKTTQARKDTSMRIYTVNRQSRYLFRVINAASNVCPFQLQIEKHNITIIAADGSDIEPISVDMLFITSGERFDFVVATKDSIEDYFIRVRALSPCNDTIEDFAVLRYSQDAAGRVESDFVDRKVPKTFELFDAQRTFNYPGQDGSSSQFPVGISRKVIGSIANAQPDEVFYFFMATPKIDNRVLFSNGNHIKYMVTSDRLNNNNIGTINNISLTLPNFPLMLHRKSINESIFCDSSSVKNCIHNSPLCACIHRVKVQLGSINEFNLIDIEDNSKHPFHLHGHKFYVMDAGHFNDTTADVVDVLKKRRRGSSKPILKDTVTVPNAGFVRIKFKADNPGFWLAHCHFDYHLAIGMGFVLQVGELDEMKDPPEGLSRDCSGFMPESIKV